MFESLLGAPIVKDAEAAEAKVNLWKRKNLQECQMKKHRVLAYLCANIGQSIEDVVTRFDLFHDVVGSNNNNNIVKVGFFADETYTTKIFELHMPYNEVVKLPCAKTPLE